jgi:SWI/SNF-related matrix-associated actin-dependent regulator of chromatin subfamily A-like protein 1
MEIRPLTPDGSKFGISHIGFSLVLRDLSRLVPGMTWDAAAKSWVGAPDAVEAVGNLILARGISLKGMERIAAAKPLRETMHVVATKGKGDLVARKYQLEGVQFLLNRGRLGCILGFSMGLGKTAVGTLAARALGQHTVIVCPASVKGVTVEARSWRRDLSIWYPKAKLFFPEGVTERKITAVPPGTDVVVINYDILYAWIDSILAWEPYIACLDEGHITSGKDSRRSLACAELRAAVSHCWILTGTPMLNRPKDLWGVLCILCPGRFGDPIKGFFNFHKRYAGAHQVEIEAIGKTVWDFSGISNAEELKQRFSWLMLRKQMTDPDVAMELPPKVRVISWVEMKKSGSRSSSRMATNKRELRAALDAAADAKLGPVMKTLVSEGYAPGGRVVACWRKAVCSMVAESYRAAGLMRVEIITGEVSQREREKRIARARSGEGILVVTIDSCSMGIDLTFASQCDVIEFVYEPWKLVQLEGRLHRFGQTKSTLFRYFAMAGSADELIISRVIGKLGNIEAIVGVTEEEKSLREKLSGGEMSEDDILKDIFAGVET